VGTAASCAEELTTLADLRDRQIIFDEEFQVKKAEIFKKQW
jgi:hypothetical protein